MFMRPVPSGSFSDFGSRTEKSIGYTLGRQRPQLEASSWHEAVNIQLADTLQKRNQVCSLINRRYAWRGYGDHHTVPTHPESATFTASNNGRVLGTVTLVVDGEAGLAADQTFADQLNVFREAGHTICELSKLAFEAGLPSKPLLASLFHIVFIYGYHHHRCTDLFIEINPRHRRFYEAMLGFKAVGSVRENVAVDAPAQLMRLEISTIQDRIEAANSYLLCNHGRSLYTHFFNAQDEKQLAEQLTTRASRQSCEQNRPVVKVFIPIT